MALIPDVGLAEKSRIKKSESRAPRPSGWQRNTGPTIRSISLPKKKLGLSPKEVEIIQNLALGKTRAQVADHLSISTHTLSTHLARSFRYLSAVNVVDAVLKLQEPLVDKTPGQSAQFARIRFEDGRLLLTFELSVKLPVKALADGLGSAYEMQAVECSRQ